MLACFKVRAVPININYRYVAAELRPLFADAGVVGVVCDRLTERDVRARGRMVRGSCRRVRRTRRWSPADRRIATFAPRSPDDHYILYTGGTTGMPRGVVWRQEDIFFTALGSGQPGRSADRTTRGRGRDRTGQQRRNV